MSLIDRFSTGDYVVTRSTPGKYVHGIWQAGSPESLTISGSLQPTNARELKLPEEGNRLKQYWKFYSDAPLVVIDTPTLADSDRVTINGESYRAMSLMSWQNVDLEYYETVLWREPENA